MRISEKVLVKGVDDEVLEHDLSYVLCSFKLDNPEMSIDKARPILQVIMDTVGDERGFELSEGTNYIRLEVLS